MMTGRSCQFLLLLVLGATLSLELVPNDQEEFTYKSNDEMQMYMVELATQYPKMVSTFSIGTSIEGRSIMALAVAARDPDKHVPLRPNVMFTSNIHGNEVVGRELLLRLIPYLIVRYGESSEITNLLDKTRLIIIPSMNPDGFERASEGDCFSVIGRTNRNGVDLNRNYPKIWNKALTDKPEPETEAVIRWTETLPIVLSMDFHGGSLVVNYPFDSRNDSRDFYSAAPDDDTFRALALAYSTNSQKMASMVDTWCPADPDLFKNGITNGADWYGVEGSLQDFMYVHRGSMAFTLEISCCKYPAASTLRGFWLDSIPPILNFWNEVNTGVKGIVREDVTSRPLNATLKIVGRDMPFKPAAGGDFYRILLPGKYRIIAEYPGYAPTIRDFVLTKKAPQAVINLVMSKQKKGTVQPRYVR